MSNRTLKPSVSIGGDSDWGDEWTKADFEDGESAKDVKKESTEVDSDMGDAQPRHWQNWNHDVESVGSVRESDDAGTGGSGGSSSWSWNERCDADRDGWPSWQEAHWPPANPTGGDNRR